MQKAITPFCAKEKNGGTYGRGTNKENTAT